MSKNIDNSFIESDIQVKLHERQRKKYRWNKSKEEGVKPYYIYNDKQLKELMAKMPKNLVELQEVSGFGQVKAKKYGTALIAILNEYR